MIMLMVCSTLIVLPGWFWARRRGRQSVWLLVLPVFGTGLWMALAAMGLGAQSLGNVVELMGVAAAATIVAYVKLFAFGRGGDPHAGGTWWTFVIVAVIALGVRLFTPLLPE